MTADIVNLRKARKAVKRKAKGAAAEQNRAAFGESAQTKKARKAETKRANAAHEAGRIVTLRDVSCIAGIVDKDKAPGH